MRPRHPVIAMAGRAVPPAWTRAVTARRIAFAAFLIFAFTGGGRIVGSDEVAMLELAQAMLHGNIAIPQGATLEGPDGRFYSKNAAGEAVIALPLVALSEAAARAAHFSAPRHSLATRFGVSFFNAVVAALLLGFLYGAARSLGVGVSGAFAAAVLLGFTTPIWVYAKSFMAEPLQALGLLMALVGATRASTGETRGSWLAATGIFLAVSVKLSMLPIAIAAALPLLVARPARWVVPGVGLALALTGHALYDFARFGTPFETGYGSQATPLAYSTPMLAGLYGLLVSSGKGVMWFAPLLWMAPAGWLAMRHRMRERAPGDAWGESLPRPSPGALLARYAAHGAAGRAAWAVLAAWATALALYSRFEHWAGDGSFGPRYLVPLLPLAFLPVAFALDRASRARRDAAWLLALAGLVVQLGGVFIYFGAQMRDAGDYPYQLPLNHPRFMSESHFNPRFSPIAGHWRMLARNLGEHLRGEWPHISPGGDADARLGISAADQQALLHALDFWWLYALYAGLPLAPLTGAALGLAVVAVWASWRAHSASLAEARAG